MRWLALGAALGLAACGGGGTEGPGSRAHLTALVAFGDTLSDVGTYQVGTIAALNQAGGAGRWVVNGPNGLLWTERLAALLAVPALCPATTGLQPNLDGFVGAAVTLHPGCTSYAQGGARVSDAAGPFSVALQAKGEMNIGLMAQPVREQIAAHLRTVGGRFTGTELVTVLVGANDVFMELQLTAPTDPQAAINHVAAAGVTLAQLVKTQLVGLGAKQVLVLNLPDMARTPFGLAQPAPVQALLGALVQTFNAQLQTELAGVPGVRLADAYAENQAQFEQPAQFGLSNVTDVACGPNALSSPIGSNGPALACNPSNLVAGDTSHYFFADSVHLTPYGHQLLSQFAARELARAGWL
jgi:phospholipase/lecithinase/hemolysin